MGRGRRQHVPSARPGAPLRDGDCIAWSDYSTQAEVAQAHGVRLDTNYYYWPANWVKDLPGLFTGSGLPMRFAKVDGTMIDVYQATTQMTDESDQTYPFTVDTLLDRALGPEGYYGAFVANMHTDSAVHAGSAAIVAAAQARGVPVISARQLLSWVDGRNGSSFGGFSWDGSTLGFSVTVASGANNLRAMLPVRVGTKTVGGVTRNGIQVPHLIETLKGVTYATFASSGGSYHVSYLADGTPPVISSVNVTAATESAVVGWTTNELATARVDFGISPGALSQSASVSGLRTVHSVQLTGLAPSTTHYYRLTAADAAGLTVTQPMAPAAPLTFTTSAAANLNCPCSIWRPSATPGQASASDPNPVELGVKIRSSVDGFITGIRFCKGPSNFGPHVGNLWSSTGALLATIPFSNETASGWQQAILSPRVAVTANTAYVVSYHTASGFYAADPTYSGNSGVTTPPLMALANGVEGPNGVFKYGPGGFPIQTSNSSNYWVDVVFDNGWVPDTTAPVVTATTPPHGATDVAPNAVVTATFDEDLNPSTLTAANVELRDTANALVQSTISYAQSTRTVTLHPIGVLSTSVTYTVRLRSGSTGIKDLAGNALAVDRTWSFTTFDPVGVVFNLGDFDGDRRSDLAVWRPANGTWYIRESSFGYSTASLFQWGLPGDLPVGGDFDGDGRADLAVWRPANGTWYIRESSLGYSAASAVTIQWGLPGDIPLSGDFDRDGRSDLAVWRPANGTWYILKSSLGYSTASTLQWGLPGDVPIAGDFDRDGKTELAVFRPSIGAWFIRYSSLAYSTDTAAYYQWGLPGDVSLSGDFDGDGKVDIAVFRPPWGQWFLRYSSLGYGVDSSSVYQWGLPGDVPVQ